MSQSLITWKISKTRTWIQKTRLNLICKLCSRVNKTISCLKSALSMMKMRGTWTKKTIQMPSRQEGEAKLSRLRSTFRKWRIKTVLSVTMTMRLKMLEKKIRICRRGKAFQPSRTTWVVRQRRHPLNLSKKPNNNLSSNLKFKKLN